jgi:hypothetical protein
VADAPDGAYVEKTGLAVVHEGEVVVSAPGSEAVLRRIVIGEGGDVHLYFPVEVFITGGIPEHEKNSLRESVLDDLDDGCS